MSEISVKPRNIKKLILIIAILVTVAISIILIGIGLNWFGLPPEGGTP